jgi:hypothetical protein
MGEALKARTVLIREIQKARHLSHNAIAAQLNARKVATARGGLRSVTSK